MRESIRWGSSPTLFRGLIMCLSYLLLGAGAAGGEVLYNGIVLPEAWLPKVEWEDIKARKPIAEPPYLAHPPAVIPIDVGRQLFVDDFLIEQTTLKRTYHLAKFHPANPVFTGGMPFSGGVFWDPQDQIIKMWYHHGGGTGYTTSKDGIHWEPGRLVLEGNTDSQCVWLDLEEKDPAKRYKMTRSVVADNRCRGWIYFSANGIDWRHVGYTGDWGDRSTFFWNPFRKLWVMSCRHGWGQPRARRYWEVRDMEKGPYWRSPGQPDYAPFWIGSDILDPARPDYKINPELYNLDAVGYESLMLGLFTIWRGQPGPREKPNEVCLGFSRDGFHWTRPDRRAFCPVSETPGQWNYANVQSVAGGCLVMGDQLYFYVSARGNGRVAGLAILRRDGFASLDADSAGGTLTTRPVTFQGTHPFVNLDAPQGELRVEILNEKGDPMLPFTRDNCVPVRGDSTCAPLSWSGMPDLSAVAGKKVRLRFHLTSGSLYAFWVSPDDSGASHGYVAAGGPGFMSNMDTVGKPAANRPRVTQAPREIDLCGTWQFDVDPEDVGVREKWYEGGRQFRRQIQVPGAWNAQGVEFETKEQLDRYLAKPVEEKLRGPGTEADRLFHVYPGPGWYRRIVHIPKSWRGKTIWLKFGGVHRNADVWIDGRHVGTHIGYVVPFEYDVTKFITPGKDATITLRVDARRNRDIDPLMGCMDTLDFLYLTWGGVHRKVSLAAMEDTWIDDVFVVPHVSEGKRKFV